MQEQPLRSFETFLSDHELAFEMDDLVGGGGK
jgi:hypothetical protein